MIIFTEEAAYALTRKEQLVVLKERKVKYGLKFKEASLVKLIMDSNPKPKEVAKEKVVAKVEVVPEPVKPKPVAVNPQFVCHRCGSELKPVGRGADGAKDYKCNDCGLGKTFA